MTLRRYGPLPVVACLSSVAPYSLYGLRDRQEYLKDNKALGRSSFERIGSKRMGLPRQQEVLKVLILEFTAGWAQEASPKLTRKNRSEKRNHFVSQVNVA